MYKTRRSRIGSLMFSPLRGIRLPGRIRNGYLLWSTEGNRTHIAAR